MSVKYVKDFEFPSDRGFTGSAGKNTVKGYMRGGRVKAPKTAFAEGGSVDSGVMPPNRGRNQAEIEAGGTKALKPGYKKGGMKKARGGVVKKAEGGSVHPPEWGIMTDSERAAWNRKHASVAQSTGEAVKPAGYSIGDGAAARAARASKDYETRQQGTIDNAMDELGKALGTTNKAKGGRVKGRLC